MKKIICLVMAIVLVVSLAISASAISFRDVGSVYGTTQIQEIAIQKLAEAGVVFGYKGSYRPNDTITRAEVCAMLVRCLYGNATMNTAYPYSNYLTNSQYYIYDYNYRYNTFNYKTYSDVNINTWSYSDIMQATRYGLVNGYPDGTFKPNKEVSYDEMSAMILRALGYKTTGAWPTAVVAQASQLGITSNVTGLGTDPATRGDVAVMIYNARNCKMIAWSNYYNTYVETNRIFGDVIGLDVTVNMNTYTGAAYMPDTTYNVFITNDGNYYRVTFRVNAYVPVGTPVFVHMNKYGVVDNIYNVNNNFIIEGVVSDNFVSNVSYYGNVIDFTANGNHYRVATENVKFSADVETAIKNWVVSHNDGIASCEFTPIEGKILDNGDKVDVVLTNGVYNVTVTGLSQKLSEDDASRAYLNGRFGFQITPVTSSEN